MTNRLTDLGKGRVDTPKIDASEIVIEDNHNPRDYTMPENRHHLDRLKANIAENGVQQPLMVRWDVPQSGGEKKPILIDGECRLRSVLELLAEGADISPLVPVIQHKGANEAERLALAITANTGKPLSCIELGRAYARLERLGWSHQDIAKRLGVTVQAVAGSIELIDSPQEVQDMIQGGEVTPALARQELRENGSRAVETLKEKAKEAKAAGKKKATRDKSDKTADLKSVAAEIVEWVGGRAVINDTSRHYIDVSRTLLDKLATACGK